MLKWLLATPPAIGSTWTFLERNPFDSFSVKVLAVKQGWFQYQFQYGVLGSLSIRAFRTIYRETA